MSNNIEEKIRALEKNAQKVKEFEGGRTYVDFGERIIECVRARNYSEAGFVSECFKMATTQVPVKIHQDGRKALGDYIGATVNLLKALPQNEVQKGIIEFYKG